jgi:hypothetical protein
MYKLKLVDLCLHNSIHPRRAQGSLIHLLTLQRLLSHLSDITVLELGR